MADESTPLVDELTGHPFAPLRRCFWEGSDVYVETPDVIRVVSLDGRSVERPLSRLPDPPTREVQERAFLIDEGGTKHRLHEVGDYIQVQAVDGQRRYAWVEDKHGEGGVYDVSNGALVAQGPPEVDDPALLRRDGTLLHSPHNHPDLHAWTEAEYERRITEWETPDSSLGLAWHYAMPLSDAFAADASGGFRFLRDGVVFRDKHAPFELGWPYFVASFDATGARLATVGDGDLVVLDTDKMQVVADVRFGAPTIAPERKATAADRAGIIAELRDPSYPKADDWPGVEAILNGFGARMRSGEPDAFASVVRQLVRGERSGTFRWAATFTLLHEAKDALADVLVPALAASTTEAEEWIDGHLA